MARPGDELVVNARDGRGPCRGCPARGPDVAPGFGSPDADVVILGNEPDPWRLRAAGETPGNGSGAIEDLSDLRAAGEGSRDLAALLETLLVPLGMDAESILDRVYLTDLVKCPTNGSGDADVAEAFDHCESYLEDELAAVDPAVVVAAGREAAHHALRLHGVPDEAARAVRVTTDYGRGDHETSRPVLVVPHWRYLGRDHLDEREREALLETVREDLAPFVDRNPAAEEEETGESTDAGGSDRPRTEPVEERDRPTAEATAGGMASGPENGGSAFLVSVESGDFERTVVTPVGLREHPDRPDALADLDEARLWGATARAGNRPPFERMTGGDLVVFHRDDALVGVGRVGRTFEDGEGWVTSTFWEGVPARLVYTVEDFSEVAVPRAAFNRVLDYDPGYAPPDLARVADERLPHDLGAVKFALERYAEADT